MNKSLVLLVSSLNSGGAERVACLLANAWSARGDSVTIIPTFSGRGECFYPLSPDINLVYLADLVSSRSRSVTNKIRRVYALRRYLSGNKPDVVVSFLSNVNVAVILATFGLNIPVVICERTDPFVRSIPSVHKIACRLTYPLADALVVQTDTVKAKYLAHSTSLKQIAVVPNPISDSWQQLSAVGSGNNSIKIIAVGRLDDGKQFSLLIKMVGSLMTEFPDIILNIFGDGPLRHELHQQIMNCSLENRIFLQGRTTAIEQELIHSDIFAMTSRYEGFPNALLEAMAIGLPSVVFDCPSGPKEMTCDGQVALLVPLNDDALFVESLKKLLLDRDLRKTLGENSRDSVWKRYSMQVVLQRWDELFFTVIHN